MENLDKDERILLILQTICEMRNKEQENTRLKEEIKKTALHIRVIYLVDGLKNIKTNKDILMLIAI